MSQNIQGVYSALRVPLLYGAFQRLIARSDARRAIAEEYIRPRAGDVVVDIGCGPGTMVPYLEGTNYIGLDLDENYVNRARQTYGNRARFIHADVSEVASRISATADLVLAIALLHHLDDKQVRALFAAGSSLLRPGGRLVTLDCVWTEGQHPIARFLIAADRGKSTRREEEYSALAHEAFPKVDVFIRSDLLRIPYDHCIMICEK